MALTRLLRTMRLEAAGPEGSHEVWLARSSFGSAVGMTRSVAGLAYVYAGYDDLARYTLIADGVILRGDTAIRDWCMDNIPQLVASACAIAAEMAARP